MPRVGFVCEQAKTVHALDRAATVISNSFEPKEKKLIHS
jgi:hypothetical protein